MTNNEKSIVAASVFTLGLSAYSYAQYRKLVRMTCNAYPHIDETIVKKAVREICKDSFIAGFFGEEGSPKNDAEFHDAFMSHVASIALAKK